MKISSETIRRKTPVLVENWDCETNPPLSLLDRAKIRFLKKRWEDAEAVCENAQTQILVEVMEIFTAHLLKHSTEEEDSNSASPSASGSPEERNNQNRVRCH